MQAKTSPKGNKAERHRLIPETNLAQFPRFHLAKRTDKVCRPTLHIMTIAFI